MKPLPLTDKTHHRAGLATVECAIVLPMMLLLVLGLIELGTALRATTIMQSAVREAGRLASMDWRYVVQEGDTPNAKVEQDIRNLVTASGLPGNDLIVSIEYAEGDDKGSGFDISDPNNELELMLIEVELPYASVSLFPVQYMGGMNLRAGVVSRAGIAGGSLTN
ncbi:MAG: pilus assembly protein [Fuerstiella sp.]|nr:pilus assembly protein [Fuerstiella sp.]